MESGRYSTVVGNGRTYSYSLVAISIVAAVVVTVWYVRSSSSTTERRNRKGRDGRTKLHVAVAVFIACMHGAPAGCSMRCFPSQSQSQRVGSHTCRACACACARRHKQPPLSFFPRWAVAARVLSLTLRHTYVCTRLYYELCKQRRLLPKNNKQKRSRPARTGHARALHAPPSTDDGYEPGGCVFRREGELPPVPDLVWLRLHQCSVV